MATEKLSSCGYVELGYGQVEPNHLSAQRTSQIYAQLPMGVDILENGQFAKYNYAAGVVNFEGDSEWMLVYNAVKVYEDGQYEADYAMKKLEAGKGPIQGTMLEIAPRLFKTNIGDIFTTNTINETELALGDELYVGNDGYLAKAANGTMKWQVVKVYTMPDGQKGVKIMRIA